MNTDVIIKEEDATREEGCLFPAVIVALAGIGFMLFVMWGYPRLVLFIINLFN